MLTSLASVFPAKVRQTFDLLTTKPTSSTLPPKVKDTVGMLMVQFAPMSNNEQAGALGYKFLIISLNASLVTPGGMRVTTVPESMMLQPVVLFDWKLHGSKAYRWNLNHVECSKTGEFGCCWKLMRDSRRNICHIFACAVQCTVERELLPRPDELVLLAATKHKTRDHISC